MSDWKKAYRSFYYETADDPKDIVLERKFMALLVIEVLSD